MRHRRPESTSRRIFKKVELAELRRKGLLPKQRNESVFEAGEKSKKKKKNGPYRED